MKPSVVFGLWIAGTGLVLYRYEYRYALPKTSTTLFMPTPQLSLPESLFRPGVPTLIHVWSADCPCSWDTNDHLRSIAREFGPKGLRIVTLLESTESDATKAQSLWKEANLPGEAVLDLGAKFAHQLRVGATPGAVLLDPNGKELYRGAYNVVRFCQDERTAYAKKAMASYFAGHTVAHPSVPFYGCAIP